jgi:sugar lactone lactonase YvrE
VFARFEAETDRPDGAAVDSEGRYWIALYRGGRVLCLSPAGKVLASFPLPAMCPTMCAFGDADLKTLYVTSARQQRDADELARLPQSGGIFAMRVDVPGRPEPAFAG